MTNERELSDHQPLELVKICGPAEGQMIEEMFGNNGIDCVLQGEESAGLYPTTGDMDEVRVWVKQRDVERARELVDAFFSPAGADELADDEREPGVEDPDNPGGFAV